MNSLTRWSALMVLTVAGYAVDIVPATPRSGELWAGAIVPIGTVGKPVTFRIHSPTVGEATWTISEDVHVPALNHGSVQLKGGDQTETISVTIDHPGFLLLKVSQQGKSVAAGAAVEPEKIPSLAVEPKDFMSFWQAQRTALAAVTANAQVTDRGNGLSKVVLDQIDGRKVYGWVRRPQGPGPFAVVLELPAFGNGPVGQPGEMPGAIYASMSIHDADLERAAPNAYTPMGEDDHTKNYYRYAVLGSLRMLEWLLAQPGVDPKRVIVTGKSQGGGLATMVAGLDNRVTGLVAVVPALAQHAGTRAGRSSGFPWWVWQQDKDGNTARGTAMLPQIEYYDITHFASRFSGRACVMAGWIDEVCPPSSVLAAYNRLGGTKTLIHGIEQDHDWNRNGQNWWPLWNDQLTHLVAH